MQPQTQRVESENEYDSESSEDKQYNWKDSKDRNNEISTQILSVTDHLSNPETLDFWNRYFADYECTTVTNEHFCDAIQQELLALVINP